MTLGTIFLIIALICFVAATFGANFPRVNLTAAGLSFATLAVLFGSYVVR